MVAGMATMESIGFRTLSFAGGRVDGWESEDINWSAETERLANNKRYKGKRELRKAEWSDIDFENVECRFTITKTNIHISLLYRNKP